MKKYIILMFCLMIASMLPAQVLSGWWTGGNLEASIFRNYDEGAGVLNTECLISVDLPEFTVMHNGTGLFLSVSPYHADNFTAIKTGNSSNLYHSFVNMKLGLDLLKDNCRWDLYPYAAFNWNPFSGHADMPYEAGCEATFFIEGNSEKIFPLRCKVITLNVSCSFRNNKPYFMTGFSVDLAGALYTILMSEYYEVAD